jgi:protein tyrosine phosphatase (PTP) superfamily phosphohydrolase (DUF442 family)
MGGTMPEPRLMSGLANGFSPVPGVITGGQPSRGYLALLATSGFRTVIDARSRDEPRAIDEPEEVERMGMRYVNVPVKERIDDATFDRFRELMRNSETRPLLAHCVSGNRVGALLLAYLVLDEEVEREQALHTALRVGLRSHELVTDATDYIARRSR